MSEMKKVRLRVTVEIEEEFPADCTDNGIRFILNEGTRCQDSLIKSLERLRDQEGCLCGLVHYSVIREKSAGGNANG